MNDIFLLTQKHDLIEYYTERFPRTKAFPVSTSDRKIDREKLSEILSKTLTKYFYVITDPNKRLANFDFDYAPVNGEEEFVHTWNNDPNIRLFNRERVLADIDSFTDEAMYKGKVNFKSHSYPTKHALQFDVVFLSYGETFADGNFQRLLDKAPNAKRVDGVKGIFSAHKAASSITDTSMVYIVDADAELKDDFDFDYVPPESDRGFAHVWRSINPVNGLEYGYGGVKLFPTKMLRASEFWSVDFTTSFSEGLKSMKQISNVTRFNTSAFETWRSAVRECTKLSSSIIERADSETAHRLETWMNTGFYKAFGSYAIEGAHHGNNHGRTYKNHVNLLNKINDYDYLRGEFDEIYPTDFRHKRAKAEYKGYFERYVHRT